MNRKKYNGGNTPSVTSIKEEILDILLENTFMNGRISDHRIITLDIDGNSDVERIERNSRRTDLDTYTR